MTKVKLTAIWLVFIAITKRILKYAALPFLVVYWVLKWIYVIIVGILALIIVFIVSLLKGKWKA